jgi:hypothetical protein
MEAVRLTALLNNPKNLPRADYECATDKPRNALEIHIIEDRHTVFVVGRHAALDKLAVLNPKIVIGGHSDPNSSFDPDAIGETKAYLENFN